MSMVYLNGRFLPLEQAQIPILDRGFIFGDGVYEVIPAYRGKPLALERHLQRLDHSLAGIRLPNPLTPSLWQQLMEQLLAQAPETDQSVYLQITRGVAPRDHAFPAQTAPTVFAMAKPMPPPPAHWIQAGVAAITRPDNRWLRCDLKTTALLANLLLRQEAVEAGAAECVLIRDGMLTEGAASNILLVHQGQLLSPPRNHLILPGITCALTLELAARHQIPFQERPIQESELRQADELMLTSSTREIVPITLLDGQPVGNGQPGPVTRRLLALYQELKGP